MNTKPRYTHKLSWKETRTEGNLEGMTLNLSYPCLDDATTSRIIKDLMADPNVQNVVLKEIAQR